MATGLVFLDLCTCVNRVPADFPTARLPPSGFIRLLLKLLLAELSAFEYKLGMLTLGVPRLELRTEASMGGGSAGVSTTRKSDFLRWPQPVLFRCCEARPPGRP